MLTIPASIAKMFVKDLKKLIIFATILGLFHFLLGLMISYYINISSGATIILISTASYGLFTIIKKYFYK